MEISLRMRDEGDKEVVVMQFNDLHCFCFLCLGDDRNIAEVYVGGEQVVPIKH